MSLLVFLIVGLVAGWIAGKVVRGSGFGLIGDMIVGIIGAFIGGWLRTQFHLGGFVGNALVDNIIYAAIGAIILLIILRAIRR